MTNYILFRFPLFDIYVLFSEFCSNFFLMNKRNFQKELESIIDQQTKANRVPRLLLHACCAPCSSYVLEYLSRFFEITVLYYNPNIYPETEYHVRVEELKRLVRSLPVLHPVSVLEGMFDPSLFYAAVKGLEHAPEGGERCGVCFALRLEESAKVAAEGGFDFFTTTLTISPLKNADLLNEIGEQMAEKYGVSFLPSDFKKKGGYLRSIELSKIYELYRQNYCGCVFSKRDAQQ